MRPLSLEISGLRSYRSRTPIEFPDSGGLIGVVGDTGSGKSSILEAMVAGLYGRTSWKRGDLSDLRNSSENTMRIVFTFEVDGRRWRVTRTSSKNNYPPSVHELVCLDDEDDTYSGRTEVTEKVVELVGLDYDAFKSAVILPQGNFERLLKASEADRIEILMSILRLNQLHEVREQAQDSQLGLTTLVGRAEVVRAGFGDPERDALEAAEQCRASARRRDTLREVSREIASIEKLKAIATERQVQLNAAAAGLADTGSGAAASLQKLGKNLERIEADRQELLDRQREDQATADGMRSQLDEAARLGESVEVLAAAQIVLQARVRELPEFQAGRAALSTRAEELSRKRSELNDLQRARVAAKALSEEAQRQATNSALAFDKASERHNAAASAVERLRQSAELLDRAEKAADQAQSALDPAKAGIQAATCELKSARAAEERAASDLLEAHRADHAAAAAIGLEGGDPCPVCSRTLPPDFVAPAPSQAVAEATANHETAREATVEAAAADARARQHLTAVEADIEESELSRRQAAERCAADRAHLREYSAAESDIQLPTADILKDLIGERTRLSVERERTAHVARDAATASASAETAFLLADQAITNEVEAIALATSQLDARIAASEAARCGLPSRFRPEVSDGAPVVETCFKRLHARLEELTEMAAARESATGRVAEAGRELAVLAERRRTEVDEPSHALLRRLATLVDRAATAATLLSISAPGALDEELPLSALADAADGLEQTAVQLLTAVHAAMADTEQTTRQAAARAQELLLSVSAETTDELQSQLEIAGGEVLRWQAAEQRARELIAPARQLDNVIAPVRDRVTALGEVAMLLRRDAFIKEVCERRQQALLGHASRILLSMTNQRYGFDRKFAIADTLTGVARKVDTLSGGETFLASLALALGLVEVARLAGGRLDAIFLDEGFGSLDQAALDQAIAALDSAAIEGRTVAVVTHVRRVMDNIDRILAVSRGPEGSTARWLDGRERENLVEEDVAAGMLA
jgi:exonuclease SbcC